MLRRMALIAVLTPCFVAAGSASKAYADDRQACEASYDQAQTLRDAKKLVAARDQLRICARATCPPSVVKDCTSWLGETESRIPSVVVMASDGSGASLQGVSVGIDGAMSRKLDGTSWDLDPGQHTFTFVSLDGTRVEKSVLVFEAQKAQRVSVILGGAPSVAAPPMVVAPVAAPGTPGSPAVLATTEQPTSHPGFAYKTVGYAVAGVGVAGLIVGGVAGGLALSTKSSDCPTETTCSGSSAQTALHEGTASTVGFIAGGVLTAAGLTLVLVAPKRAAEHVTRIEAAPLIGASSTGLMLSGRWW